MKLRLAAGAAVAAAAVLAAGCGGSGDAGAGGTPPGEWAKGFCSSLATWTTSIRSFAGTLDSNALTIALLQTAARDALAATATYADRLQGLGKPDLDGADEVVSSLDRLAAGLQEDVAKIEQEAGDVSGIGDIARALPLIGRPLASMGVRVQTMLRELEQLDTGGRLADALEQTSACDALTK